MMTESRSILALPAAAGARLLALSWIDQVAVRAEAWRTTDERNADAAASRMRDALSHLRASLRNFRDVVGDAVDRSDRRRARRLFGLADRATTMRYELRWLRQHAAVLPEREQANALWLANRLSKQSALADERLTRGIDRDVPRLERRLARRLRTYTAEVYLGEAVTEAPFATTLGGALRASTRSLAAALAALETRDGAGPLHDVERAVERVLCCLEPLLVLLPDSATLLNILGALRDAANRLYVLDRVAERIIRALEREAAARARYAGMRAFCGEATLQSLRAAFRDDRRRAHMLLAARAGHEARECEADVRREWLGGHPADVFAKLRGIADRLDGGAELPQSEAPALP